MERSQEYEPLILDLQKSQAIPRPKRRWLIVLLSMVAIGGVAGAMAGIHYVISSLDSRKSPIPENTPVVVQAALTPTPMSKPMLTPMPTVTHQTPPSTPPVTSESPFPKVAPVASPTPQRQVSRPTVTPTSIPTSPGTPTEPPMGFLTLHSSPENAEVRIEGKLLGYTPLEEYALRPGTYTIRFVYQGNISEKKLTIIAGKTTEYTYRFDGLGGAGIEVRTFPRDCEIWVNGEFVGHSPFTRNDLLPGTYTIIARKPGYASAEKTVTLEKGQPHSIMMTLKRLDFVTDPGSSSSSTPRPLHPSERQ